MNGPGEGPNEEDKMKAMRVSLVIVLLAAVLGLMGGCSRHYVDIYINENCQPVTLENGQKIEVMYFHPGDYVIFNNTRASESVKIQLPTGMFEVADDSVEMISDPVTGESIEIESGHRAILKVVGDATTNGRLSITGDGCPAGNPEAKVGEGP